VNLFIVDSAHSFVYQFFKNAADNEYLFTCISDAASDQDSAEVLFNILSTKLPNQALVSVTFAAHHRLELISALVAHRTLAL
jgi:hypothetical protein